MTEEQIKQKAEEYCNENFSPLDVDRRQYAEEDFIAGYHSRDEEIEQLKTEIEELKKKINSYETDIKVQRREAFRLGKEEGAIETAKKLLSMNLSLEQIALATSLPLEKIQELASKITK